MPTGQLQNNPKELYCVANAHNTESGCKTLIIFSPEATLTDYNQLSKFGFSKLKLSNSHCIKIVIYNYL